MSRRINSDIFIVGWTNPIPFDEIIEEQCMFKTSGHPHRTEHGWCMCHKLETTRLWLATAMMSFSTATTAATCEFQSPDAWQIDFPHLPQIRSWCFKRKDKHNLNILFKSIARKRYQSSSTSSLHWLTGALFFGYVIQLVIVKISEAI